MLGVLALLCFASPAAGGNGAGGAPSRAVVLVVQKLGLHDRIYSVDPATGSGHRLKAPLDKDTVGPIWSHDGAFVAFENVADGSLFRDEARRHRATDAGNTQRPRWSCLVPQRKYSRLFSQQDDVRLSEGRLTPRSRWQRVWAAMAIGRNDSLRA